MEVPILFHDENDFLFCINNSHSYCFQCSMHDMKDAMKELSVLLK